MADAFEPLATFRIHVPVARHLGVIVYRRFRVHCTYSLWTHLRYARLNHNNVYWAVLFVYDFHGFQYMHWSVKHVCQ